jgi:hypothetical protein
MLSALDAPFQKHVGPCNRRFTTGTKKPSGAMLTSRSPHATVYHVITVNYNDLYDTLHLEGTGLSEASEMRGIGLRLVRFGIPLCNYESINLLDFGV